jgi:hypothetical protein
MDVALHAVGADADRVKRSPQESAMALWRAVGTPPWVVPGGYAILRIWRGADEHA